MRHPELVITFVAAGIAACAAPDNRTVPQQLAACLVQVGDIARAADTTVCDGTTHNDCCTSGDCEDHHYPIDTTCPAVGEQPAPEEEVMLPEMVRDVYDGPDLRTALIGDCEDTDDPDDCDGMIFYFHIDAPYEYLASLEDVDDDGDGLVDHTDVIVYDAHDIAVGAKVRTESGSEVYPLVAADHTYARMDAPVEVPDGPDEDEEPDQLYFDMQNDCFEVEEVELECGTVYICWIC